MTGHQQAIFRDKPHLVPIRLMPDPAVKPIIQPLCVFAAGRQSFDIIVRRLILANEALKLVFDLLPLQENGWEPAWAQIARAGTSADKWPIWRITRG